MIDDLLRLSRVNRAELVRQRIDFTALVRVVFDELRRNEPDQKIHLHVQEGLVVEADRRLWRVLLDNLLGNARKFSTRVATPRIEVGADRTGPDVVYYVRDSGAGFDMAYAHKLFTPFQRLHRQDEFPGTGIGLATVRRIVDRHGRQVRAEGVEGTGATIFFSLPPVRIT